MEKGYSVHQILRSDIITFIVYTNDGFSDIVFHIPTNEIYKFELIEKSFFCFLQTLDDKEEYIEFYNMFVKTILFKKMKYMGFEIEDIVKFSF